MKQEEINKEICRLAGVEYKVIALWVDDNDRKEYTIITLEILVKAMWAINMESGESMRGYAIQDNTYFRYVTANFNVLLCGSDHKSFRIQDYDNEQQALRKAIEYVIEHKE